MGKVEGVGWGGVEKRSPTAVNTILLLRLSLDHGLLFPDLTITDSIFPSLEGQTRTACKRKGIRGKDTMPCVPLCLGKTFSILSYVTSRRDLHLLLYIQAET